MKQPFPHYKFATNHLTITWITLQNSWIRNRTHRNQTLNSRFRTSFCRFHTIFSPQINIINAWITPQNVAFATEHAAINHETAVIAPPFRHLGNQNAGNQAYIRRKYTTQPLFWVWFSSFLNVGKAIFNIVFACSSFGLAVLTDGKYWYKMLICCKMDVKTVECFVKFGKSGLENGGRVGGNW